MGANYKVAASLFAVLAAGCSANARFDLSEFQDGSSKPAQSTASIPSQSVYTTPQQTNYTPSYSPTYGSNYGYQPRSYVAAPETASLGWNAEKPETGSSNSVHIVRTGDTLWGLSKQYNVPMTQIYSANGLVNDRLTPGQHLIVPRKASIYEAGRIAAR